jgi:hypothetical protein
MSISKTIIISLLAISSYTYKIAVLNDVHIDLSYNATQCPERISYDEDSQIDVDDDNKLIALLGRYGCDPPYELAKTLIHKIKQTHPDVDFFLNPGDIVMHGVSINP